MRDDPVAELIGMTREVSADAPNAKRLWQCYQDAFWTDDDLYRRITAADSSEGINGLTEPLELDEIQGLLDCTVVDQMTLEVPDPQSPGLPPLGFVIVPYCTQDPASIERFRDYYLGEVFDRDSLEFYSDADRQELDSMLAAGNVGYFGEFVSVRDRRATLALRIGAHHRICVENMHRDNCAIVGKCLDMARIGDCVNEHGNQPIKQVAAATGMKAVAGAWQQRELNVSAEALGEQQPRAVTAELRFDLYVGNTAPLAAAIREKLARIQSPES